MCSFSNPNWDNTVGRDKCFHIQPVCFDERGRNIGDCATIRFVVPTKGPRPCAKGCNSRNRSTFRRAVLESWSHFLVDFFTYVNTELCMFSCVSMMKKSVNSRTSDLRRRQEEDQSGRSRLGQWTFSRYPRFSDGPRFSTNRQLSSSCHWQEQLSKARSSRFLDRLQQAKFVGKRHQQDYPLENRDFLVDLRQLYWY